MSSSSRLPANVLHFPHPVTTWTRQLQRKRRLMLVDGLQRAALATALVALVRTLVSPAPFDYGESDTATWVWLLRHGQPIYGQLSTPSLRLSHYPPLQLWLVAKLAPSDGAILFVARALSLCGLVTTALAARLCVVRATGSTRAGWNAALLVATTAQLVYFGASGRADLFALGLAALAMTTVALRVRGWPFAAALLFALALLCKHNLVVLPLSVLAWSLWRQPRHAIAFGLTLAGIVAACVWRLQLFVPLVEWTHTGWRLSCFLSLMLSDVLPGALALVVVARLVRNWRLVPERATAVLEPWLVACAIGGVWLLALARVGSSSNYLLEWLLAVAVTSTMAAQLGVGVRWQRLHVVAMSLLTLVKLVPLALVVMPRVESELALAHAALATTSGPVLAERTWLATAAGQPPVVIPFLSHQLAQRHLWDEAPLIDLAQRKQLTRVLLDFSLAEAVPAQRHDDRFAPALLTALRHNYVQTATVGELHVYAPAPSDPPRTTDANAVAFSAPPSEIAPGP